MIEIKIIKKINGRMMVKKFKETYGSIERLKKFSKENPDSVRAYFDLKDWEYYLKNLDEEIDLTETLIGEDIIKDNLEQKK